MLFLTAYYACKNGVEVVLTGSDRMKKRPIKILVDALEKLGADIKYLEKVGYPPLEIKGKILYKSDKIYINVDVSSQYSSALMMIAPLIPNRFTINIIGEALSKPYLEMTLSLMQYFGINYTWEQNSIKIPNQKCIPQNITI